MNVWGIKKIYLLNIFIHIKIETAKLMVMHSYAFNCVKRLEFR